MTKTLVIMAAGMGSRYGGLKQIDSVGPSDEYLLDYSVYDGLRAGFDQFVFVIRAEFATAFQSHLEQIAWPAGVRVDVVNQELTDLPAGFTPPAGRTKPWGTGHAVWVARRLITNPFVVITADDFYGRAAFQTVGDFLDQLPAASRGRYGVVGYQLGKTLSRHGWVARGLLKTDPTGRLTSIHEHTKIGWVGEQIVSRDKTNVDHPLSPDRLVSMVMFAFTPDFLVFLDQHFQQFLAAYATDLTREFFTPTVVNELIHAGQVRMQVLPTDSQWFGVTYHDDRHATTSAIQQLVAGGVYPASLWEKPEIKN